MKTEKISKSFCSTCGRNFQLLSKLLFLFLTFNSHAREFKTERPDKVRSAYTIKRGRFAIEPEFINYAIKEEEKKRTLTAGEVFIRYGLTNYSELQINTESYIEETFKKGSDDEKTKITGNTEFAWKLNLKGNDEGDLAMAIQPYLLIPTAGGDSKGEKWEGGLAFNLEWEFFQDHVFGLTVEPNNVRKNDELEWQSSLVTAFSIARPIFHEKLNLVLEYFHEYGKNSEQPQISTIDVAVQYHFSDKLYLDMGTFIGASPDADDLQSFLGGSYLF